MAKFFSETLDTAEKIEEARLEILKNPEDLNNPMMANFGMPPPGNYPMMFAPMGGPMPGQPASVPAPAPENPAPVALQ